MSRHEVNARVRSYAIACASALGLTLVIAISKVVA